MSYSEWSETDKCFTAVAFQLHLECTIRKLKETRRDSVNVTYLLLVYAGDSLLSRNVCVKKKDAVLVVDSREVALEVNCIKPHVCSCLVYRIEDKVIT
jgi:hypothetical protein